MHALLLQGRHSLPGFAMHNNYMCYRHRDDAIPPVIENEPFLIERLDTPEDIKRALCDDAARFACNRLELMRAGLIPGAPS